MKQHTEAIPRSLRNGEWKCEENSRWKNKFVENGKFSLFLLPFIAADKEGDGSRVHSVDKHK